MAVRVPALVSLRSISDVPTHINPEERTLILWDADDTLVATGHGSGPRGRLLESLAALEAAFGAGDGTEHLVLSAGSIDDLFHRTELTPKDKMPLLAHMVHHFRRKGPEPRVVYIPAVRQHVVFTDTLLGVSIRASNAVAPSPHSVTIEAVQKVDFALACALSTHWDHVLLIDNQTMEVGWVQPGLPVSAYTSATAEPSEVFSTEYMRVHTALRRHVGTCRLTLAHLRVSDTHKVLPGEKPIGDAEYESLAARLHAFNESAVPMVAQYFDEHVDMVAEYGHMPLCRDTYSTRIDELTVELAQVADLLDNGADATQEGRTQLKAVAKRASERIAGLPVVDAAHNAARGVLHRITYSPGGVRIAGEVKAGAREAFASLRMHDA